MERPRCLSCRKRVPATKRADAKYCSNNCAKKAQRKRARVRRIAEHADKLSEEDLSYIQRIGAYARAIRELGLYPKIKSDELTYEQVATVIGAPHRMAVKRAMDELDLVEAVASAKSDWVMADDIREMLALDLKMPDDPYDEQACFEWADAAARQFLRFEARFFATPHERTGEVIQFIRKDFHLEWIRETLYAIATGGYLQILSPPRHGKSQLMAHFAVWLICRNPNIRILWVSSKEPIAARFVTLVRIKLQNRDLVEAVLPPGQSFRPPKKGSGTVWGKGEFEVDCRLDTIVGATMLAVGREGDILSLNADLIVCDDLENFGSTETLGNRRKTRHWFGNDLDSRKMEHTAFMVIGSRQHYDDLYGYNLEDPNFRSVVNSAHDPACEIPEDSPALHVECMLFPELRSFRWLMTKKYGSDARDTHGSYEMVYLNDPQREGLLIFDPDDYNACLNPSRTIGIGAVQSIGRDIPEGRRVAGLDPSSTGFQSAVAYAGTPIELNPKEHAVKELGIYDVQDLRYMRWMIGLADREGGGIENWLILAEKWRIELGVYHWVIEDNNFQKGYLTDPRVKAWKQNHGVHLEGHSTYGNKHDPRYGVGAMSRLYRDRLIDVPYGDGNSRVLADKLRRQALGFVDEPTSRKRLTDMLMASWFPQKVFRRWEKELVAEAAKVKQRTDSDYGMSYPNLSGFSQMNQAPWR